MWFINKCDFVWFQEPEVISVLLESRDMIGLGFDICGSMRDGIYVSQVHNRGPAIETGLIKIGNVQHTTSVTHTVVPAM